MVRKLTRERDFAHWAGGESDLIHPRTGAYAANETGRKQFA